MAILFVEAEPEVKEEFSIIKIYPSDVEKPHKKTLYLTLHRRWFEDIYAGCKKKEFRDWTPYWNKRLLKYKYDEILFRNGYGKNRPFIRIELTSISFVKAPKPFFMLCLGEILEFGNYKK